jgi:hypothetical protein
MTTMREGTRPPVSGEILFQMHEAQRRRFILEENTKRKMEDADMVKQFFTTLLIVSICTAIAVLIVYGIAEKTKDDASDFEMKKLAFPTLTFDSYCMAKQASYTAGINGDDFFRMIWEESCFRQSALSPAGAIGYCQLMPATAAGLRVNPWNGYENMLGGARHFRMCLSRARGDRYEAFCKYNSGHNRTAYPAESHRYAARCTGMIAVAMR